MNTVTHVNIAAQTRQLPFFEVDQNPVDQRYGSIKVYHNQKGQLGVLDYFYGSSQDAPADHDGRSAFYVTRLAFFGSLDSEQSENPRDLNVWQTLERALLYIAACMADDRGENVIYCRPGTLHGQNAKGLWKIRGIRDLLDNYGALVQAI